MRTIWGNSPFCITADAAYVFRWLALSGAYAPALPKGEPLAKPHTLHFSRKLAVPENTPSVCSLRSQPPSPRGRLQGWRKGFRHSPKASPWGSWLCAAKTEGVFPQRRAFAESGAVNAVCRHGSSREKAILENPQIFQNCEIINNISADDAQSKAERILNRLTAPLRIKIAIPAAWCYTTYKGRGLAACALCRKI